MQSKATTVKQYLAELPEDRREAITAVRKVILDSLDSKFEEGMQYGMIGYHVPHSVYPAGYHSDPKQPLPFAALASQKNYMSLYLMSLYGEASHEKQFRDEWKKTGKKLDMGKCCIRFRRLEDLALDVIGRMIGRVIATAYIEACEAALQQSKSRTRKKTSAIKKALETKPANTAAGKKAAAKKKQ
jgi:hypothetical protein